MGSRGASTEDCAVETGLPTTRGSGRAVERPPTERDTGGNRSQRTDLEMCLQPTVTREKQAAQPCELGFACEKHSCVERDRWDVLFKSDYIQVVAPRMIQSFLF